MVSLQKRMIHTVRVLEAETTSSIDFGNSGELVG